MNVIDFGMNISQAVDTGRFHHQWLPDKIYYETGALDQGIIEKLQNTGHEMEIRKSIGRVNAIMMVDGKMSPGADKRGMNAAAWF
jgi:gamma-glutamyltranspeptidase/glutathione hydrolase